MRIILVFITLFFPSLVIAADKTMFYFGASWLYSLTGTGTININSIDSNLGNTQSNFTLDFGNDLNYAASFGVISSTNDRLRVEAEFSLRKYYAKKIKDDDTGMSNNVLYSDKANAYFNMSILMANVYYDIARYGNIDKYSTVTAMFGIGGVMVAAPLQVAAPKLNFNYQAAIGTSRQFNEHFAWDMFYIRYYNMVGQTSTRVDQNNTELISINNLIEISTGVRLIF